MKTFVVIGLITLMLGLMLGMVAFEVLLLVGVRMRNFPNLGTIAGLLVIAYILGALASGLCWALLSAFLGRRPRLSRWLAQWRLLNWVAAISALPDETVLFLERAYDRGRPWRERLGWKRVARQTVRWTAAGLLILAAFYSWGAYKRSVQWYAIEPPSDISGGLKTPMTPDLDAWLSEWAVKGVFWSKDACLQHLRRDVESERKLVNRDSRFGEYGAFIAGRRCIAARNPHAPDPEPDSESLDDPGD